MLLWSSAFRLGRFDCILIFTHKERNTVVKITTKQLVRSNIEQKEVPEIKQETLLKESRWGVQKVMDITQTNYRTCSYSVESRQR